MASQRCDATSIIGRTRINYVHCEIRGMRLQTNKWTKEAQATNTGIHAYHSNNENILRTQKNVRRSFSLNNCMAFEIRTSDLMNTE